MSLASETPVFSGESSLSVTIADDDGDVFASMESRSTRMFDAIAEKIGRHPCMLEIPLSNIARWLAKGHPSSARLTAWRDRIESAIHSRSDFASLLELLRDPSPEAMKWKGFSPFAGILTGTELNALR